MKTALISVYVSISILVQTGSSDQSFCCLWPVLQSLVKRFGVRQRNTMWLTRVHWHKLKAVISHFAVFGLYSSLLSNTLALDKHNEAHKGILTQTCFSLFYMVSIYQTALGNFCSGQCWSKNCYHFCSGQHWSRSSLQFLQWSVLIKKLLAIATVVSMDQESVSNFYNGQHWSRSSFSTVVTIDQEAPCIFFFFF